MHFAIIHGNFKAFVIKLEEYLTKKQPQRKTKEREWEKRRRRINTGAKARPCRAMSGKILRDVGKWCNPGAQMDLEVDLSGESHRLSLLPSPGMPQASVWPAMKRLTAVLCLCYQTGLWGLHPARYPLYAPKITSNPSSTPDMT